MGTRADSPLGIVRHPVEASPSQSARQKPRLWPREHGAYVELAGPLLTVLLFLPPATAAIAYAVAACALFLTHEPLLILLGRRGERVRSAARSAALARLTYCVAAASAGV